MTEPCVFCLAAHLSVAMPQQYKSLLLLAYRLQPFASVGQQCVPSVVELFKAYLLQATFGSMASQMREHLTEEEDTGLTLLRQNFSEKEVAPVSTTRPAPGTFSTPSLASRSARSCYQTQSPVLVWGDPGHPVGLMVGMS